MPENTNDEDQNVPIQAGASKLPMILIAVVVLALIGVGTMLMMPADGPRAEPAPGEYVVQTKMYQLKDGSFLKLSFSIVVAGDKVEMVKNILELESPGRLPNGLNMLLGNKTREELITGTHKREAFSRELQKMLDERVFSDYNSRQVTSQDAIEVKEVLISDFVTQSG
jgi:flagellar basal body-associated protein FliL